MAQFPGPPAHPASDEGRAAVRTAPTFYLSMTICAVKGCTNTSNRSKKDTNITFITLFPSDPIIAACWRDQLRINRRDDDWNPTKKTKICSVHFEEQLKYLTDKGLCKLRKGAIPTKGLHISCAEQNGHTEVSDSELKDNESHPDHGFHKSARTFKVKPNSSERNVCSVCCMPQKALIQRRLLKKTILQRKQARIIKTLLQKVKRLKKKNDSLKSIVSRLANQKARV